VLEFVSKQKFDQAVAVLTPRLLKAYGWTLVAADYPLLDIVFEEGATPPLRVRLSCEGWDEEPPSIALLTPGGQPIPAKNNDPVYGPLFARSSSVFNAGPHDNTSQAFVCMRGSREYHTHAGHRTDSWDNYRNKSGNDLIGLVAQLHRVWKGKR
jgi:hypothetical protein